MAADVTVNSRNPTLRFPRFHSEELDAEVALYWNGTVATNGDGMPNSPGAPVDYNTRFDGPMRIWPAGRKVSIFGGGFLAGGFVSNTAIRGNGFGFLYGPFLLGGFLGPGSLFTALVRKILRDGEYTFGFRKVDRLGNEATSNTEITVEVAAPPRPPTRARLDSYDSQQQTLTFAWSESPDLMST